MGRMFVLILGVAGLLTMIKPVALSAQVRTEVVYQNSNGKMMVDAVVNNVKGRFLLDTGAPCSLTYTFAKKLGLDTMDSLKVEDSNGNLAQVHLCTVQSLKLGDVDFNTLQMLRLPKGEMIESFGVDGIIGYNLMKQGIVKFEDSKHLFTFTTYDRGLGIDYGYAIPLIKDAYLTLLPVQLGKNSRDTVMLDCGAREFYEMSQKSFDRVQQQKKDLTLLCHGKGVLSMGAAGLERESMKYRAKIPHFVLGKKTFDDVATITTNATYSRIGAELLKYGILIIDYVSQVLYFIPNDPKQKINLYTKDWDVTITVLNNELCAGVVWSDSNSGLHGGEKIVEINGIRYDQVDLLHATTRPMIKMSGNSMMVGYLDEAGNEKKAEIRRR